MKRLLTTIMTIVMEISFVVPAFACDQNQTNTYITQILFGDDALTINSDENVKMLLDALYLCSEQSDNQGQDKIDYLKSQKVSNVPPMEELNIRNDALLECAHNSWEYKAPDNSKVQSNRKSILRNTVNTVFDFGIINNWFGSSSGKCNSFAALLYYSHILSDYLADNPSNTETSIKGREISAYVGQPYIEINGGQPSFTSEQKTSVEEFIEMSDIDSVGRCGVAFANIGIDRITNAGARDDIGNIIPAGWNQQAYDGVVDHLYNRCHLIAHQLIGIDTMYNLITGTRYLNETGMKPFEDKVAQYIRSTENHVLYRVTPVYKGNNLVASGVQMEAYSVEDEGEGICFNVYCYNVQPGVEINYANGKNSLSDTTIDRVDIIPFAIPNPTDSNPDLIYEINKHLEILFEEQKNSGYGTYNLLSGDIYTISFAARKIVDSNDKEVTKYLKLKECEYEYFETLKTYVPLLLKNEIFFKSTFS